MPSAGCFSAPGCWAPLTTGAAQYAAYATHARALPGWVWLAWFSQWGFWLEIFGILTFVFLLFPTGRLPSPRWRPLAWLAGVLIAGLTLAASQRITTVSHGAANPARSATLVGVTDRLFAPFLLVAFVVLLLTPGAALLLRLRRARGIERQQLKWFVFTAILALVGFVLSGLENSWVSSLGWGMTLTVRAVWSAACHLPRDPALPALRY